MDAADELSNSDLDAAVARECFGEDIPLGYALVARGEMNFVHDSMPVVPGTLWSPTTDARDAERVWLWLVETEANRCNDDLDSPCWDRVAVCINFDGSGSVLLDHEDFPAFADAADWKRALCLAALAVARKETP